MIFVNAVHRLVGLRGEVGLFLSHLVGSLQSMLLFLHDAYEITRGVWHVAMGRDGQLTLNVFFASP